MQRWRIYTSPKLRLLAHLGLVVALGRRWWRVVEVAHEASEVVGERVDVG